MATKLTKPVTRETEITDIHNNKGDVLVTLESKGLRIRGKGTKREFFILYENMRSVVTPPANMPAKYTGNVFGWLIETQLDANKPADATA